MKPRFFSLLLLTCSFAPTAILAACSSDDSSASTGGADSGVGLGTDGGNPPSPGADSGGARDSGSTVDAGSQGDAGGVFTHTRVAHLSPGAPNVDFCLIPHGAAGGFGPVASADGGLVPQAPVFEALGLTAGIGYGQVSAYDPGPGAPAGGYDFRIVAAGTADCSQAGIADFPNILLPEGNVTIAATGLVGAGLTPSFTLAVYTDDPAAPASEALLRFVHVSPGTPAVNVGTLSEDGGLSVLFKDVSYGQVASAGGSIDKNGYASLSPLPSPGVTVAAAVYEADAAAPPSVAISVPGVTLAAGETATAFAVGELSGSVDAGTALGVLLCDDYPADAALALLNPSCTLAH